MLPNVTCLLLAMGHWIMLAASLDTEPETSMFRDLICYACAGRDCPVRHYSLHIRHLIVGCQACYKEWHPDDVAAKRECFSPASFTEMQHQNQTELTGQTCGLIEKNSEVLNYCFCYTDYCNDAIRVHSVDSVCVCFAAIISVLSYVWTRYSLHWEHG